MSDNTLFPGIDTGTLQEKLNKVMTDVAIIENNLAHSIAQQKEDHKKLDTIMEKLHDLEDKFNVFMIKMEEKFGGVKADKKQNSIMYTVFIAVIIGLVSNIFNRLINK
jgi:hypothetical protein